jgi:catechol 2,3-dioxygenase-like lactoylglutathione lyase family enzyme
MTASKPSLLPRADHVALPIFEVEASYRFYTKVLQLPLIAAHSGDDWGGKPWLMMIFALGDNRQLALCALRGVARPVESGLPKDLHHIAFGVATARELAAWKRRLRANAIAFSEEEHGPTQRSIYFEDPNGIVLELTSPPAKRTRRDPAAAKVIADWIAVGAS